MSPFLSLLTLSSLFIYVLSYNCGGPEVANFGPNYLQLVSQAGSATFNFNASLPGNAGNICLDLGECAANVNNASSLYISYRTTNPEKWSSDLAIAFYGTGQSFGGCCETAGSCAASTQIGSFPEVYNAYVNYKIQINSGFSPALASGFTAICIVNTCASGTCTVPNRFFGTFVLSNLNCSAAPVTSGHPIIVPIQAPTSPTVQPTGTCPSTYPSNPTYIPTIDELIEERK
jgi:hypothetical protein